MNKTKKNSRVLQESSQWRLFFCKVVLMGLMTDDWVILLKCPDGGVNYWPIFKPRIEPEHEKPEPSFVAVAFWRIGHLPAIGAGMHSAACI
jgi:hypothetical protein